MKSLFPIFSALIIILLFTGCKNNHQLSTSDVKLVDNGQILSIAKFEPKLQNIQSTEMANQDLKLNVNNFKSTEKMTNQNLNLDTKNNLFGRKPQPFVNEDLPKSYTDRTFFKGLVNSTYDISLVPGYIVEYDSLTGNYQRKTLVPVIKDNRSVLATVIGDDDGLIYNNTINKSASFNASAIIGSLSVGDKQMMELVIQDMSKSSVPDSLVDVASIVSIVKNQIPENKLKNYFYIKSATLTLINNKIYTEASFDAKVNCSYVTAEGQVFNSTAKFSRNRIVSMELISLQDLIANLPLIKQ